MSVLAQSPRHLYKMMLIRISFTDLICQEEKVGVGMLFSFKYQSSKVFRLSLFSRKYAS